MVPVAIGSQTAGSVIRPAAYCGVLGLKPTRGLVDLTGVMALSGEPRHARLVRARRRGPRPARPACSPTDGPPARTPTRRPAARGRARPHAVVGPRGRRRRRAGGLHGGRERLAAAGATRARARPARALRGALPRRPGARSWPSTWPAASRHELRAPRRRAQRRPARATSSAATRSPRADAEAGGRARAPSAARCSPSISSRARRSSCPRSPASRRRSTTASPATRSSAARGRCSACPALAVPGPRGPRRRADRRAARRPRRRPTRALVAAGGWAARHARLTRRRSRFRAVGRGNVSEQPVPWEGRCPTAPNRRRPARHGRRTPTDDRLDAHRALAGVPRADVASATASSRWPAHDHARPRSPSTSASRPTRSTSWARPSSAACRSPGSPR